jgi:SP family arabinose:H+ symporter-like MFS transporter
LLANGRPQKGREVLQRISSPLEVDRLVNGILHETTTESRNLAELYAPGLRARLLVAVLLAVFQQISGINTVLYYGSLMFSERFSSASATAAIGANVVVGAVNLVGTIAAMLLIDRIGRRALLMLSSGGMGICLCVLVL